MTTVTALTKADISAVTALWNEACIARMPYLPCNEAELTARFFNTPHFDERFLLTAKNERGELLGICIAYLKKEYLPGETYENTPLYLVMLLVKQGQNRKGIGTELVNAILQAAKNAGKKEARITYRSPVSLSWLVPNTKTHTHNNAPGVDKTSPAFAFFCKHGFQEQQTEYGMHLSLADFVLPEKYAIKLAALNESDIEVTLYNAQIHHGFEELFTALNGEIWRKTIRDNLALATPLPVIVAAHAGKIVGFAGPIDKEPSGRGWFNGIATHPQYERRGIAFVMFCRLMLEFKAAGAEFSTLFTDAGNPAAGLYQSVGFSVAKEWAVMQKGL